MLTGMASLDGWVLYPRHELTDYTSDIQNTFPRRKITFGPERLIEETIFLKFINLHTKM